MDRNVHMEGLQWALYNLDSRLASHGVKSSLAAQMEAHSLPSIWT